VDKAFVSRVTGDLCQAGYVSYSNREGSHYNNKFILTETGLQVMHEVRIILEDAVEQVTAGITEEQLLQFYTILEQLDNGLCQISEN
jgi:DNA-binding MarR family transcriptional regulator